MPTTTVSLAERLEQAQREAQALRERLSHAEHERDVAVAEQRYADAERAKAAADEAREPLLVAQAHVQALQAGIAELQRHREDEQRAQAERERREQAEVLFEQAKAREAEALDDAQRLLAEVSVTYSALVEAMNAAVEVESRIYQARLDAWDTGKTAGHIPQEMARPSRPNMASSRFEQNPVLTQILRNPRLPF